ncbi:hypothetical protein PAXINDRAFT_90956 [Paxillus involutus ATCC 200175]|uniref:Uncharacterized protein n=1 Tax=Paxillus involutus ATCC 200175 TaxID=664439 RepID=A0A0C9SN04_PAXIN|nr:hypothetical protein PAXINDRAFT_90956 [Paxillus involutus ATCC 200175]
MMQRTASQRDEQSCQAWRDGIAANFTRDQFAFIDESSRRPRAQSQIWSCIMHHGANV